VWVPGLAGLRGTGLRSEYCAGLCRPWGLGQQSSDIAGLGGTGELLQCYACLGVVALRTEMCVFVSHAGQALGAWPGRAEILQGCAGLRGVAGKAEILQGWGLWPRETELLQVCAGLAGMACRDPAGLCQPVRGLAWWIS
jgi:hypothetical protein